jgi:uncharacterized protein related to proFAR isomerase
MLSNNSTLKQLYLNSNQIGSEGIINLTEELRKNSILTHLDIGNNKLRCTLRSNQYAEFVKAVAENTSLEWLWLQSNEVGASFGSLLGKNVDQSSYTEGAKSDEK